MELGILKTRLKELQNISPKLADLEAGKFEDSKKPILQLIEDIKGSRNKQTKELEAKYLDKNGNLKPKYKKNVDDTLIKFNKELKKIDLNIDDVLDIQAEKQNKICNNIINEIDDIIGDVKNYIDASMVGIKETASKEISIYKTDLQNIQKLINQDKEKYKDVQVLRVYCPYCMASQDINPNVSFNKCTICKRIIQEPYYTNMEEFKNK